MGHDGACTEPTKAKMFEDWRGFELIGFSDPNSSNCMTDHDLGLVKDLAAWHFLLMRTGEGKRNLKHEIC